MVKQIWDRKLATITYSKAIIPVIHLVVEHGIALESHGQNMILAHKEGLPVRIALKDFHEGLEFYRPFLKEMNKCRTLLKCIKRMQMEK